MAQLLAMAAFYFEGGNLIVAFRGQLLVKSSVPDNCTPAHDARLGVTPRIRLRDIDESIFSDFAQFCT